MAQYVDNLALETLVPQGSAIADQAQEIYYHLLPTIFAFVVNIFVVPSKIGF